MPTRRVVQQVPVSVAPAAQLSSNRSALRQRTMDSNKENEQSSAAVLPSPMLKLSFGGVDFCLVPTVSNNAGSVTFESMGTTECALRLTNFTGTLRVKCEAVVGAANDHNSNSRLVEEHNSPSPEKPTEGAPRKSRTQQQLPFVVTNKRRNTSNNAKKGHVTLLPPQQKPSGVTALQKATPTTSNRGTMGAPPKRHCTVEHSPINANKKSRKQEAKVDSPPFSPILTAPAEESGHSSLPLENIKELSQTQKSSNLSGNSNSDNISNPSSQQVLSQQQQMLLQKDHDAAAQEIEKILERGENSSDEEDEEEHSVATKTPDDLDLLDVDEEMMQDDHDDKKQEEDDEPQDDGHLLGQSQPSETEEMDTASVVDNQPAAKPEESVVAPAPRWGHTLTKIDHGNLLLYGGQSFDETTKLPVTMSDVHIFDGQKWCQPVAGETTNQIPRQWHTSTYLPERRLLIVFGGETFKSGKMTTSDKDNCWVLDTEVMLWYPPAVSGDVPKGRSGHTATLLPNTSNNELVVFGGVKGQKWLNSVSILDTSRWIWKTPKIQGVAPKPRSYHSAVAIGATYKRHEDSASNVSIINRIVIFGGNDGNRSFNDVCVLEKHDGTNSTWRWMHPTVSGKPPIARTGNSAVLMDDQKTICIYGGWDPNADGDDIDEIFEDCYLLDTATWSWRVGPNPVAAGLALDPAVGEYGGAKRVGHTTVLNTTSRSGDHKRDQILCFGGRVPGARFTGDFQTFDVEL